ncbi:glycoside hydrolase family 3 C-terminal domain-containing protein [Labilibaculum sp.]|uniref:glycoside hydrolase family 3 C-terminal domain-containing protein n=1 Tax=Labilibaculum sp. TaxID=2060723 RepID=UPI003565695A
MKAKLYLVLVSLLSIMGCKEKVHETSYEYLFQDPKVHIDDRVDDLIVQLSLEEKLSLMTHEAQAIPRLNIPYYNWWSECLHGVARSVPATVFPQAIGLAATFDRDLIRDVADAISDEARGIYNEAVSKGIHKQYMGLTFWSPNVNIFRDPRWGRGHETYGEDPYLSGELGAAFVNGLQGTDPDHLKVAACAKHFAVHNGPEALRHSFNAIVNDKDLNESYLPAFKKLIDADVAGVMCAYNRTNDEVCCGSPELLMNILREEWGFDGYVVSDCGALYDFHKFHKSTKSPEESAALAIKNDVNVNCGNIYNHLSSALEKGLVSERELDHALRKQLKIRFKLGMFDEDGLYSDINQSVIRCEKHTQLSRKTAQKSIVLLKNKNHVLPLQKDLSQVYVTGNNAADINVLLGNYYGVNPNMNTVLEGIAGKVSKSTIVQYNQGILQVQKLEDMNTGLPGNAAAADATIAVIGQTALLEGEAGDAIAPLGGDREKIELPENQLKFVRLLRKACGDKPLIVVICSGSAIAMPELEELADAIVWAWYPGEQGGNAIADILFGDVSPSGKLPISMYKSTEDLGDFEDYNIAESKKTYRYFEGEVSYPFGYGLNYSTLQYEAIGDSQLQYSSDKEMSVKVKISNTGSFDLEEVVQLYTQPKNTSFISPKFSLRNFKRISLAAGESKEISFDITDETLSQVDDSGITQLFKGETTIYVGGALPIKKSLELGMPKPVEFSVCVK